MLSKKRFYRGLLGLVIVGLSSQTFAVSKGDWIVRFVAPASIQTTAAARLAPLAAVVLLWMTAKDYS